MQVPLRWLREFVDINVKPETLADRLTLAGLEVTKVTHLGRTWDQIYVGTVIELAKHPNADRLWLAAVSLGQGRVLQVVTGATNLYSGAKVPLALPGATLYDGHSAEPKLFKLKPGKLRGILSEGMVCSEKELGISEDHEGILILDPLIPEGMPLRDALGDVVLDLDLTPNMVHAMSVYGLAREVAAITGAQLREMPIEPVSSAGEIDGVSVTVEDPGLCPRYCLGVVSGVKVAPSPPWMQLRIKLSGMRPINNVVDITNYVMLELGQPLHAFDLDTLSGRQIIVRRARGGESIVTLDGVSRVLDREVLVIADAVRPVAIAGVMGGSDTEVTDSTVSIALESANFHGPSVRATSRKLKLRTEAAVRFEKGLDVELPPKALLRALRLITELCGGVVAEKYIDEFPGQPERATITLKRSEVPRLLGFEVSEGEVERILRSLGFRLETAVDGWRVQVPSYRRDVSLPADLVEEVARIIGYDQIPERLLPEALPHPQRDFRREAVELLKDRLVAAGLYEVITYSLIDAADLERLWAAGQEGSGMEAFRSHYDPAAALLKVANPLSAEHEYLRPTLLPGLLTTVAQNLRRADRVALFEMGRVFRSRGIEELPEERLMLGIVVAGQRHSRHWLVPSETADFYDLKGIIEFVSERLHVAALDFKPLEISMMRPGAGAWVLSGSEIVGFLGELHPKVCEAFDIPVRRCAVAELDVEKLLDRASAEIRFRPIPRFPAVVQDFSLLVDLDIPAGQVAEVIRKSGGSLVRSVKVFDRYVGEEIPQGKKSLAFEIVFQSDTGTLTDEEVATVRAKIVGAVVKELGAQVRGM